MIPFNIFFHFPFIIFSLDHFSNSKLFDLCVLQFVFVKGSNNFFSIKIVHIICPQDSIFDLSQILPQTNLECNLLQKSFSNIINFKFRIFVIKMFAICVWFYINGLHFNCAMIFVIVFTNHIIYFIKIHTFWNLSHVFINLFLRF